MELYGLTRADIKKLAVRDGSYYVLSFGEEIEVTVIRKSNSNGILTSCLAKDKVEDRFVVRYTPNNKVYFDKEFVNSLSDTNYVSCKIDKQVNSVYIGNPEKYSIKSGILATTGVLSLNGYVQRNRDIYYTDKFSGSSIKSKITLLSIGLRGENLFGIYHLPRERGLALSVDDNEGVGLTTVAMKMRDCWSWNNLTIEDWFEKCKVQIK